MPNSDVLESRMTTWPNQCHQRAVVLNKDCWFNHKRLCDIITVTQLKLQHSRWATASGGLSPRERYRHHNNIEKEQASTTTSNKANLFIVCDATTRQTLWNSSEINERSECLFDFIININLSSTAICDGEERHWKQEKIISLTRCNPHELRLGTPLKFYLAPYFTLIKVINYSGMTLQRRAQQIHSTFKLSIALSKSMKSR